MVFVTVSCIMRKYLLQIRHGVHYSKTEEHRLLQKFDVTF